jgi:hypothetical protein
MIRLVVFILILSFTGCRVNNNSKLKVKDSLYISEIDEFENLYRFKGILNSGHDSVYAISFKQKVYDRYNIKNSMTNKSTDIIINKDYNFIMDKVRPIFSMRNRYQHYIVVEKDTLWKGSINTNPPKYYIIRNSVGLLKN